MQDKAVITRNILIEDLINDYSFSVRFLMENGIRCIRCGEPIWGTLEEAAKEKDFSDEALDAFIEEMKQIELNEKAHEVEEKIVDVKKMS